MATPFPCTLFFGAWTATHTLCTTYTQTIHTQRKCKSFVLVAFVLIAMLSLGLVSGHLTTIRRNNLWLFWLTTMSMRTLSHLTRTLNQQIRFLLTYPLHSNCRLPYRCCPFPSFECGFEWLPLTMHHTPPSVNLWTNSYHSHRLW